MLNCETGLRKVLLILHKTGGRVFIELALVVVSSLSLICHYCTGFDLD